ncbi:MAG: DUF3750 domain-containing protein [Trichlorobacter sp.]
MMRYRLVAVACLLLCSCSSGDWRTANRDSAGIAPRAAVTPQAVVQVYGADTWGWRGWFAIHTWIATKRRNESQYIVYEVVGWRQRLGKPVVRIESDIPDRYWYGNRPKLLRSLSGDGEVERVIDAIDHAARTYPWPNQYTLFPGPNSNTFTAWIGKNVPELMLELPVSAIGSGYLK